MHKVTHEVWLDRFRAAHGDRYEYPETVTAGGKVHIRIKCAVHGDFKQRPEVHAKGRGCVACGNVVKSAKMRGDLAEFLRKARAAHGARYDYAEVTYSRNSSPVRIKCALHGTFDQKPALHWQGAGCPRCAPEAISRSKLKDAAHFIANARRTHGEKYSYDRLAYRTLHEDVTITCPHHGDFLQKGANHTTGHGCPKCVSRGPSAPERELLAFVQSLRSDAYGSDRKLIAPKELDIVVPSARIAIELNGVYWHSDQRAAKNAARDKRLAASAVGYRLLAITCAEWKERRSQFERMIRNALGCSQGAKLHARQCVITEPTTAETLAFLDAYHPQQPGRVYTRRFGLHHPTHGLVAVMTFNLDAYSRNRAESGVWDLTRFATCAQVRGGASKLFKHAVAVLCTSKVVSYSAHDWFAGGVYGALGFTAVKESPPDYRVYHPKLGFRPKSAWARKHIPNRLAQIGSSATFDHTSDKRTEWDIEDAVGALRVWDSGKTLWEWRKEKPGI